MRRGHVLLSLQALTATIAAFSGVAAAADEANWVDQYIEGHGACERSLSVYQPQPLGLPLQEWTDADLEKLRAAIARCEAKYENERHEPLSWGQPVYEAVLGDVKANRQNMARQRALAEARKVQGQQVELARQHQIEAQERERQAQEDEVAAANRAAAAHAAQVLAAREKRDRTRQQAELAETQDQAKRDREAAERARSIADQEAPRIAAIEREASDARRARAQAEQHLAEVRQQIEKATARKLADLAETQAQTAEADALARGADMRALNRQASPDQGPRETHPAASVPPSTNKGVPSVDTRRDREKALAATSEKSATVPATTTGNYVACKMLNELVTTVQAISRNDGDTGAALVNAGECFLVPQGTRIRVKAADAEAADPTAACVFLAGHAGCLWMPTDVLESAER